MRTIHGGHPDPIEEAAREIADTLKEWEDLPIYEGVVVCMQPILQRLYDAGKKAGAEEERQRAGRELARIAKVIADEA